MMALRAKFFPLEINDATRFLLSPYLWGHLCSLWPDSHEFTTLVCCKRRYIYILKIEVFRCNVCFLFHKVFFGTDLRCYKKIFFLIFLYIILFYSFCNNNNVEILFINSLLNICPCRISVLNYRKKNASLRLVMKACLPFRPDQKPFFISEKRLFRSRSLISSFYSSLTGKFIQSLLVFKHICFRACSASVQTFWYVKLKFKKWMIKHTLKINILNYKFI